MPVEIFAWPGSPGKGLLATAEDGELPAVLQATNRHGMPRHILLAQGAVVAGHRRHRLMPGAKEFGETRCALIDPFHEPATKI
jgi:hypothetical protein